MHFFYTSFFLLLLAGCSAYDDTNRTPSVDGNITDKASWYNDEDNNDVLPIRVTIPEVNDILCAPYTDPTGPLRPCTFEDIQNDTDAYDDYEPEIHVHVELDGFEDDNTALNAIMKQKGKSTRSALLKSYRITLDSDDKLWRGEHIFQLNKHPDDDSRIRQKISFDLFETIPNFTSLKTQFMQLFVDGEDFGLFTHVEAADEIYLRNRGWNEEDKIYKAQNFTFKVTDALALTPSGKMLDKDAFEACIEPKSGDNDHRHLIQMLEDINNAATDEEFEKVFNKYYDRENYLTWMAINIVVSNKDTTSQNFFLYNPKFSDKYYFLPWDYDGTFRDTDKYAKWEYGIGNWWGVSLHRKFLSIKKNREDLDKKVDELRAQYITPTIMQSYLDKYKPLVDPFQQRDPDIEQIEYENYIEDFNSIVSRLDVDINLYKGEFGVPMPFWQTPKENADGSVTLWWDKSVDLEGDELVYDLTVADNPEFIDPIIEKKDMQEGVDFSKYDPAEDYYGEYYYKIKDPLPKGEYFMKVVAREKNTPEHRYQIAFDSDVVVDDIVQFGVKEFQVE